LRQTIDLADAFGVSALSVALGGASLILFRIEGLICLVMALPLAIPLALIGAALGYAVIHSRAHGPAVVMLAGLGLMPGSIGFEYTHPKTPPVFAVTTAIDIEAPPETVWQAIIAPSKLPEPHELLFRAGIAYPLAAHIDGSGPTATRYCNFSTGDLVEPVLEWQEPSLLRFSVTSNPEPMVEMSPYRIRPPHLKGFLVSRQGEFRITALNATTTRVEATTWYQHNLWPAEYWRWWSDYIIHQVHNRVLDHVRRTANYRARGPLEARQSWSALVLF
jgi:hypothetical protein